MGKFLIKNKKYLCLILITAIAFNIAFLPLTVLAADKPGVIAKVFGWLSADALLFISDGISMLISGFFGMFIYLEAQIIDYLISPANFSFTHSQIVTLGWGITRDLANMFFILILLIIAFATVLRIQSYAIKQLWWKVLMAALLINFSLVIAGFVLDFTQVLTTFFLKQITEGDQFLTFTLKIANSMKLTNFYMPNMPESVLGGIGMFGVSAFTASLNIILTLVGLVITTFVFGAAAIFLIVRILYIWFLLIFAPIVWMLWIMPATSRYFSQWWNKFIQWSFFAPIYVFMMYLSLSIFDKSGKIINGNLPTNPISSWNTPATAGSLTTASLPSAIFQWIVVIAMMFGSLIVAQKFGVEGANGARKMLTGWGTGAKNWAGRQLRRTALGIGAKEATEKEKARPGWLIRGAQKFAGTAIPGRRLIAGQVLKMQAGEATTVEAAQKQFSSWTSEGIKQYLKKSPGFISNALFRNQQMGAALALKEKGDLDELEEPRIRELATLASRKYSKKELGEILKVAPHLAPEFKEDMKKTVGKIDKANEILIDSLRKPEVVMNLNPQQLKTIVQKASKEKIKILKDAVEGEFNKLDQPIKDRIDNDIIGARSKDTRNKELRRLEEDERTGVVPIGTAKTARARFTVTSPAWEI